MGAARNEDVSVVRWGARGVSIGSESRSREGCGPAGMRTVSVFGVREGKVTRGGPREGSQSFLQ